LINLLDKEKQMKPIKHFFLLLTMFFAISYLSKAQCYMDAYANGNPITIEICLGDQVVLTANGNCPTYLMNNDFNNQTPGTGWQATNQAMFNNPCAPHSPDGTPYLWMGSTSTAPRILTTVPFDVSGGGIISFEMRYALQGAASPCEGPDLYNEGVSLQYSINNGTTWVDIAYFAPNGDILTTTPTATNPGIGANVQTIFTVWGIYTYTIPPAAQTTATRFRWAQLASTSAVYDHWGLDNVSISVPPPNIEIFWAHGPTGPTPPPVSPTVTTTYTAFVTDQTDTAQSSVEVIVHQPPVMEINNLSTLHCLNGDSSAMTGTPPGGTFSGPGVVGNVFNPAIAGMGSHDISYDYHIIGNSIGAVTVFEDCFFTDKGWTGYGGAGGWARGVAAVAPSCSGNNGPNADHTQNGDNFILGTFLGACYNNSMPANNYITSPVINCSGVTDVELEFWRWAGCETQTYDKIGIQAFDGTNWTTIWQNGASFSDNSWTHQVYDVSAQADNNPNFRIRFYIGPTDGSVTYIGWNIDDVAIKGIGPVTDTLCSFTTTASTIVVDAPTAEFTMPDTVCVNEPITITFTGLASNNATFTWDFGGGTVLSGSNAGPYNVSWSTDGVKTVSLMITENGCSSLLYTSQIIVLPLTNPLCACWTPPVTIIANDELCTNQNLNVSTNGSSAFQYNWNFAGATIHSGSGIGPYIVQWVNAGTYTITLSATDGNCYPFDTSFTVTVYPLPQITISGINEICGQMNGSATATGGPSYQWSNGGTTETIIGLSAGLYTVTVNDGNCSNTASVTIANIPGPTASFGVSSNTSSILDGSFNFTDLSIGATTWDWSFGDNNFSNIQNPSHTYAGAGTYTVTLLVTDDNNCTDVTERDVVVQDLHTLYIPSAFTPDGDGINDFFGPVGISVDNDYYNMYIFDRWGKIIFHSQDVNHHWDGSVKDSGRKVPGVYTYRILYREIGGKEKKVMGTVTLILP